MGEILRQLSERQQKEAVEALARAESLQNTALIEAMDKAMEEFREEVANTPLTPRNRYRPSPADRRRVRHQLAGQPVYGGSGAYVQRLVEHTEQLVGLMEKAQTQMVVNAERADRAEERNVKAYRWLVASVIVAVVAVATPVVLAAFS